MTASQHRHDHNRGLEENWRPRSTTSEAAIRAHEEETIRIATETPWMIGGPVTVANEIAWARIRIAESLARERAVKELRGLSVLAVTDKREAA